MMTITTVIFDVYQTLAPNNACLWHETFARLCREQGLSVDVERLWQEWKARESVFRRGRVNLAEPANSPPFKTYYEAWRDAFRDTFDVLDLVQGHPEEAARRCVEALAERPLFQDALDTIRRLREQGWRLGILSNSDDVSLYPLVHRHGLKLDGVLSSETVRAYKPHPHAFHSILELLGVPASQALYVGDSLLDDVHGAKLMGMRVAWVNRNGEAREDGLTPPDFEVRSLEELEAVLASFPKGRSR